MKNSDDQMIAACGLVCRDCSIRKAPFDSEAAEEVVAWYRSMDWLKEHEGLPEVLKRKMYCQGCHGDRSTHWSPDCWILDCCVDQKGLTYCSECEDFPCDQLVSWSQENDSYREAFNNLKSMAVG